MVIDAAAASSYPTPSGMGTALDSGRCASSQNPPHSGPVWNPHTRRRRQSYSRPLVHMRHVRHDRLPCETTRSPGSRDETPSPTLTTSPAASVPDTCGMGTVMGRPRMAQMSSWLRAAARTRNTTSPGRASGGSMSLTLSMDAKSSSLAYRSYTRARMPDRSAKRL